MRARHRRARGEQCIEPGEPDGRSQAVAFRNLGQRRVEHAGYAEPCRDMMEPQDLAAGRQRRQ